MTYANGRLPASALAPIGGGLYLRKDVAAAWLQLQAACERKYGRQIRVSDAYRPVGSPGDYPNGHWSQWYAWGRYLHGGNLAARPGTSNHGEGTTVDINTADRPMLDDLGPHFGFSKRWSDAPSEAWHIKWSSVQYHGPGLKLPSGPRTMKSGMHGKDVRTVQVYLRGIPAKNGKPYYRKKKVGLKFGQYTKSAVKVFQREHKLKADGIVGPKTLSALKKAYRRHHPSKK